MNYHICLESAKKLLNYINSNMTSIRKKKLDDGGQKTKCHITNLKIPSDSKEEYRWKYAIEIAFQLKSRKNNDFSYFRFFPGIQDIIGILKLSKPHIVGNINAHLYTNFLVSLILSEPSKVFQLQLRE